MSFNLKKNFRLVGGTSIIAPELLRNDTSLTDSKNIDMYDNFSLCKRRGEELVERFNGQGVAAVTMSNGEKLIIRANTVNGITKIIKYDLIIEHTGTEVLRVEVGQEENSVFDDKYIKFFKDEVEVARYSLGGKQNPSFKKITDLVTEINVPNVTVLIDSPGAGDAPNSSAYSIEPFNSVIVENVNDRLTYEFFETITGSGIPVISNKPIDYLERDGVLYFTTDTGLFKYDGTNYYRAGLPKPNFLINPAQLPYVGPDPQTYVYRIVYNFTDALGNVIQSTPADEISVTRDSEPSGTYSIDPDPANLSGYGTGVTYTVLRTKANGSIFFVLADGLDPTVPYTDNMPDANLAEDFLLPPFELNADTDGKYIDIWRNSIVMTGFADDPDLVLYEDVEFTEGFSISNSFLTQSRRGGENSGIFAQDNSLYAFKEDSITLITGDLGTGQFQVDKITEEGIGAVSNNSIIEHQGRVWFMSKEGIYSISQNGLKPESLDLDPIFEKELSLTNLRNCFGFNNTLDDRLMFTVPKFAQDSTIEEPFLLEKPITYVYNPMLEKWFIWDTIDFSRGISINNKEIWYIGSSLDNEFNNCFYSRMPRTFTSIDFADRGIAISSNLKSNWDTLGEPSVPKKYVRMKIYSIDNQRQQFETPDFTLNIETEHDYKYDVPVSKASLRFYELNNPANLTERTPVNSRRVRLLPKKAKSLRYILKNNELNKNILISGIEFEVATEHAGYMRSE